MSEGGSRVVKGWPTAVCWLVVATLAIAVASLVAAGCTETSTTRTPTTPTPGPCYVIWDKSAEVAPPLDSRPC